MPANLRLHRAAVEDTRSAPTAAKLRLHRLGVNIVAAMKLHRLAIEAAPTVTAKLRLHRLSVTASGARMRLHRAAVETASVSGGTSWVRNAGSWATRTPKTRQTGTWV